MVHLITYDLESPHDTSQDYTRVIDGIKLHFPVWCHLEKSVWLVSSDAAAASVRDTIRNYLFPTDILFVARLSGNWASFNLGNERVNWVNQVTF